MYSSEDLERFYFQYQTEAMPTGVSIEQFCSRNKVPYNIFYKWYKDTRNKIVEVKEDGLPTSAQEDPKKEIPSQDPSPTLTKPSSVRILVELRMTNGMAEFLNDGSLPIDNNLAERVIRPLTAQRNAMLHFGSDEGAEMAATYHSIISTVKMQGRSAWEYLGKFFTKIFNGCRDFFSLRPDKIGLAICQ